MSCKRTTFFVRTAMLCLFYLAIFSLACGRIDPVFAAGYCINGQVYGPYGTQLILSGDASQTTTSGGNGAYSFCGLANGSYTVTPVMSGYTFSPASQSVTLDGYDQNWIDFGGTAVNTYSISGTITSKGSGLLGVSVSLAGSSTAATATDLNGNYSFSGVPNGNYVITPSMSGYTFAPTNLSTQVQGANVTGENFLATASSASHTQFSTLHGFGTVAGDGTNPYGSVILVGSTLYGMTLNGGANGKGAIYQTGLDGSGYTVLYSFGSIANDGAYPFGALTAVGSTLYGMTCTGGAYDYGTIFQINTDGSGYRVLHSFAGNPNDGAYPFGSLTLVGSTLYGTTEQGGDNVDASTGLAFGTIFSINTDGSGFQVLYNFGASASDGTNPLCSLVSDGSTLYGYTLLGGGNDYGTIFSISATGAGYQVLHAFSDQTNDGADPFGTGSLVLSGSTLYGTTLYGGSQEEGAIFSMGTDGSGFQVLYSFGNTTGDGTMPAGQLVLSGSTLYGMTLSGGSSLLGTIFGINTDGSAYNLLYNFTQPVEDTSSGDTSLGSLLQVGSTLYGPTATGGTNNLGTLLSFGIIPVPTVTSVSPEPAAPGALVTITGTGFGATQGSSAVSFNGVSATVSSWSQTQIQCLVPSGATTGALTVTTSGGTSNATNFTVMSLDFWNYETSQGNDWYDLNWFGSFYTVDNVTLYHQGLGWITVMPGSNTNGIIIFDPEIVGDPQIGPYAGTWFWTSVYIYPWLYNINIGHWYYYAGDETASDGTWYWFYDNNQQAWVARY